MPITYNVLILGASYGSLLGTRFALAGHNVHLVCLPAEVDLINSEGAIVRLPVRGHDGLVEINSRTLPGKLTAGGPATVYPGEYALVVLAMQEPQYRSPDVRALLDAVGKAGRPCMSIMNMPPLPYLRRVPGLNAEVCKSCYTEPAVWESLDPALMTLCSPDPQAFRPPDAKVNVLQVRLPTNFKAARFVSDAHTAILRQLAADVEASRFDTGHGLIGLPVKLKVHDSVFVPLAKWSMLIAGNYRCAQPDSVRPIHDTVHSDLEVSRAVYHWVMRLCMTLGAAEADLVPFDKYAEAAKVLVTPSSAARALAAGAPYIERVDRLVQTVAAQHGLRSEALEQIVALVDQWLERNRKQAA